MHWCRQVLTRPQTGASCATRREFLGSLTAAVSAIAAADLCTFAVGQNATFVFQPDADIIPAPSDPTLWSAFREQLRSWRDEARRQLHYDDTLYGKPEFAWAASSFACCFLMMCDERFYDPGTGVYQIEAFLDHGQQEFGGYDSLVLWHAYPRIGVDHRNQFDFYRDMPGGLAGLRDLSRRCHARGVRVFIDYNPWDTGTRREGRSDLETLADIVATIEADGIFLDTMSQGAAEFRARLDAARPGVILEGEGALPLQSVHDHHASWAQWFRDSEVPGVLRNKWFERRHMQHQIKRWDQDHTGELHTAWMNGSGMMVWENVFGSWVGWSARDRSILRSMLPIQRRFSSVFTGDRWTPLVPTCQVGVYASLWQADGSRLWTLVNRRQEPVAGPLLEIEAQSGEEVFDVIRGEAHPAGDDRRQAAHLREYSATRNRLHRCRPIRDVGPRLAGLSGESTQDNPAREFRQHHTDLRNETDCRDANRATKAGAGRHGRSSCGQSGTSHRDAGPRMWLLRIGAAAGPPAHALL